MDELRLELPGVGRSWPSQSRHPSRARPARRDAKRTRDRLLRAAAALLTAERTFTLSDVAAHAGVSTATAYRYFENAGDIALAVVSGFLDDVEERVQAAHVERDPERRLLQLCEIWVESVIAWGPALAHLRSPEGFLARRARRDPEMLRSLRHIEPAVRGVLRAASAVDPTDDEVSWALAVWNALADPREVLDQHVTLSWPAGRIVDHLHRSVIAISRSLAAETT